MSHYFANLVITTAKDLFAIMTQLSLEAELV
jgi:hypothetical protein